MHDKEVAQVISFPAQRPKSHKSRWKGQKETKIAYLNSWVRRLQA